MTIHDTIKLTTTKNKGLSRPLAALLTVTAVLVAGIAVAAVMAMRTGSSHSAIWSQGYQYGQAHPVAASIAPKPVAQRCALMANEFSAYSLPGQETEWALGCTAALQN
jgi:hypothetical protein